jgi:hypothetical protein
MNCKKCIHFCDKRIENAIEFEIINWFIYCEKSYIKWFMIVSLTRNYIPSSETIDPDILVAMTLKA